MLKSVTSIKEQKWITVELVGDHPSTPVDATLQQGVMDPANSTSPITTEGQDNSSVITIPSEASGVPGSDSTTSTTDIPKNVSNLSKASSIAAQLAQSCPICEEVIEETLDSIYCEGQLCMSLIHRQCAGLSKTAFSQAVKSSFSCPKCRLESVEAELSTIKKSKGADTSVNPTKKFSIIVQGIEECEEDTSKLTRQKEDLSKVVSLLSKIQSSVNSQSIKDIRRLGKYNSARPRPRPILVQFLRSADASSILSKAGSVESPYSIQHYMTPAELSHNAVLLKKRWAIHNETGTDLKRIKIRQHSVFVDEKLHGKLNISTSEYEPISPSSS